MSSRKNLNKIKKESLMVVGVKGDEFTGITDVAGVVDDVANVTDDRSVIVVANQSDANYNYNNNNNNVLNRHSLISDIQTINDVDSENRKTSKKNNHLINFLIKNHNNKKKSLSNYELNKLCDYCDNDNGLVRTSTDGTTIRTVKKTKIRSTSSFTEHSNKLKGFKGIKDVKYEKRNKNFFLNLFTNNNNNKNKTRKLSKKLEIIHNVNGYDNLFKTNETFNLNEINYMRLLNDYNCENNNLMDQSLINVRNLNGLITPIESPTESPLTSKSFSGKKHKYDYVNVRNFNKNILINEKHKTTIDNNYDNIYSNINSGSSSNSLNSSKSNISYCSNISNFTIKHDLTNNYNSSVIAWMTSLRKQTIDYEENTICNIKSIPSKCFDDYCGWYFPTTISTINNNNNITPPTTIISNVLTKQIIVATTATTTATATIEANTTTPTTTTSNNHHNLLENKNNFYKNDLVVFCDDSNKHVINYCDIKNLTYNNKNYYYNQSVININNNNNNKNIYPIPDNIILLPKIIKNSTKFYINSDFSKSLIQIFDKIMSENSVLDNNKILHKINISDVTSVKHKEYLIKKYTTSYYYYNNNNNNNTFNLINNLLLTISLKRNFLYYDKNLIIFLNLYKLPNNLLITDNNLLNKHKKLFHDFIKINFFNNNNNNNKNYNYNLSINNFSDFINVKKRKKNIHHKNSVVMANIIDNNVKMCINNELISDNNNNNNINDNVVIKRNCNNLNLTLFKRHGICDKNFNIKLTDNNTECENENIYQKIWNFHTIGRPRDSYNSDLDIYEYNNELNINNVNNNNNVTNIINNDEWEIDEEFSYKKIFNEKLNDNNNNNNKKINVINSYKRIYIYYNLIKPEMNKIIYEIEEQKLLPNIITPPLPPPLIARKPNNNFNKLPQKQQQQQQYILHRKAPPPPNAPLPPLSSPIQSPLIPVPKSVQSWKYMLLNFNYLDDEEDFILTDMSTKSISITNSVENLMASTSKTTQTGINSNKLIFDDNKIKDQINRTKFGRLLTVKKDVTEIADSTETKQGVYKTYEGESLFELQIERNESPTSSSSTSSLIKDDKKEKKERGKLKDFISNELKDRDKGIVFGIELERVEKDIEHTNVPKFVVECVRLIEIEENIQTNGIYRASGNKNLIEKVKKKMDRRPLWKESKYQMLQEQDVHTLTSSLKLFFRESKTDLIPDTVFNQIDSNFELDYIKNILFNLPEPSRSTLKYLIKHLNLVAQRSSDNLMTAINLSIVWGATIFANQDNIIESFEDSKIMKKNFFIRLLIENFEKIFDDNDIMTSRC